MTTNWMKATGYMNLALGIVNMTKADPTEVCRFVVGLLMVILGSLILGQEK